MPLAQISLARRALPEAARLGPALVEALPTALVEVLGQAVGRLTAEQCEVPAPAILGEESFTCYDVTIVVHARHTATREATADDIVASLAAAVTIVMTDAAPQSSLRTSVWLQLHPGSHRDFVVGAAKLD